jgi:hypothetical protein
MPFHSDFLAYPDFAYGQGDRSDKLVVTATGTGGLAELQEKLDPAKASYAYARVTYSNDKESQREKFILITWIGAGCKIMRKAKVRPLDFVQTYAFVMHVSGPFFL